MTIFEKIRTLRKARKLTQEQLAEMVGYEHRSSIGRVENGEVDIPFSKVVAFAKAFNVTTDWLLGYSDDARTPAEIMFSKVEKINLAYAMRRILLDHYSFISYISSSIENTSVTYSEAMELLHKIKKGSETLGRDKVNLISTLVKYDLMSSINLLGDESYMLSVYQSAVETLEVLRTDTINGASDSVAPIQAVIAIRDLELCVCAGHLTYQEFSELEDTYQFIAQSCFFDTEFQFSQDWLRLGVDSDSPEKPKLKIMTHKVPIYGAIPAGTPLEAIQDNIIDHIEVPSYLAQRKGLFALRIDGDSMNMIAGDGMVAVFEATDRLEDGELGAVYVNGYDATFKKFHRLNNMIILEPMSYNPEHEPIIIKDAEGVEVTAVGRLVTIAVPRDYVDRLK